jgi:hypothetical protein
MIPVFFLTEDANLLCEHRGVVSNAPSQDLVTISTRRVLVENDPEGRSIARCPNVGPTIRACLNTLAVREGYSEFIRIGGNPVCLDTVKGRTDGSPPGMVDYLVRSPGQDIVEEVP